MNHNATQGIFLCESFYSGLFNFVHAYVFNLFDPYSNRESLEINISLDPAESAHASTRLQDSKREHDETHGEQLRKIERDIN